MKSRRDDMKGDDMKKREESQLLSSAVGRRDLMKLGAGVVASTLAGKALSHAAETPAKPVPAAPRPRPDNGNPDYDWRKVTAGPGYKNDANRLQGNGPMDNTTRQLVEYTQKFSESELKSELVPGIGFTII